MSRTALAFMSYVNLDDQHEQGRLTKFRERLSGEVRMQTGEPFDIFQDRKDIAWGQQWQERINDSLNAVTFLIPIITPAFFKSAACRDELERFLKREEELKRGDLILPVYYVKCPVLSDKAKREQDELAQIIAARQYADWTKLRIKPLSAPPVRKALAKMAEQIVEALERSETARAAAMRKADAAKETLLPQQVKKGGSVASRVITIFAKPQPTPTVKAEPPTVVVDAMHRGDYATINAAIKAVKSGTRILVRPGLYREGLVIYKPVEIVGDGDRNEIVIEAYEVNVILFKANMGRIANLTLRQAGGSEWYGVEITRGRLDIESCDISSQRDVCVIIRGETDPRLRQCNIHNGKGVGIIISDNGQGILEDNEIVANEDCGVLITTGGNPTMRRNRISQNDGVGILIYAKGGGIFEDNDLRGNTKGAWKIAPDCEANVQRRGNKE